MGHSTEKGNKVVVDMSQIKMTFLQGVYIDDTRLECNFFFLKF